MSSSPPRADRGRLWWIALLVVVGGLVVVRNLAGLDSAPVGAYVDEASIGYNAWTISTAAVDEHGAHLPLYFTAFGEYKNPVYIYTLSALLRVLPLTVTTERLPAAVFGLLTCVFITLLAWQRTRSRPVTLATLVLVALTPWLTIESRVGFEVVSMLALVAAALWCLSVAADRESPAWYLAAGCFMAVAVYAYSTGRVAMALLAVVVIAATLGRSRRIGASVWTLPPMVVAYAGLLVWNRAHPGALTARFDLISIAADGASATTVAARFVINYLTYFGPDFLLLQGDRISRHSTHFGGVLLWATVPLLGAGLWAAWQHRDSVYTRIVVGGLLVAPVSAAVTNENVPHALRASVMLPFVLALSIEGLALLLTSVSRPRAAAAVVLAALAIQGLLFTVDMYAAWPARSAVDFDAGEIDAITRASAIGGTGPVMLSSTLDPPYISAAFALQPRPPGAFTTDSMTPLLTEMHMVMINPADLPHTPGAIAVLSAGDPAPAGADRLFDEVTPDAGFAFSATPRYLTVVVYRLR